MLLIGMKLNDYTIVGISAQFRAGHPDGAVIIGAVRRSAGTEEFVVAEVRQEEIDSAVPARFWHGGFYFASGQAQGVSDHIEAMQAYLERSGMAALASAGKSTR